MRCKRVISPLEGEMSPKATEGGRRACSATSFCRRRPSPVGPTPSGLPAISPSRGEIGSFADFENLPLHPKLN
ncbi:hypothetical protein EN885_14065 [Mesorhizobium sp. M6A.T.Cr.TU.014.01.1.1]|nr:hypothetical protein EN885_14065 [Mesorhizobium sp. M6A.T.Cr.TU.014.01.1.1]RWP73693.1 MAG: hypothetical protein EOR10_23760 [Mesorhizobium sp.]RWQ05194.1 MAG: hypothetical protein EOR90_14735 [Mesorhizobium sp.]RWQ10348.1 MAG: hypothetical protein EOR91_06475 [Mesorhizobium sp.]